MGKLAEAEAVLLSAQQLGEESLKKNHYLVGRIISNLGYIYHKTERLEDALESFKEANEIFVQSKGPGYALNIKSVNMIASILIEKSKLREALEILKDAEIQAKRDQKFWSKSSKPHADNLFKLAFLTLHQMDDTDELMQFWQDEQKKYLERYRN